MKDYTICQHASYKLLSTAGLASLWQGGFYQVVITNKNHPAVNIITQTDDNFVKKLDRVCFNSFFKNVSSPDHFGTTNSIQNYKTPKYKAVFFAKTLSSFQTFNKIQCRF